VGTWEGCLTPHPLPLSPSRGEGCQVLKGQCSGWKARATGNAAGGGLGLESPSYGNAIAAGGGAELVVCREDTAVCLVYNHRGGPGGWDGVERNLKGTLRCV